MRAPTYEYVIYKGDDVVCGGTRKEILKKLNMSPSTFKRIVNPSTQVEEAKVFRRKGHSQRMVGVKVSIAEIKQELGLA
ncbi:hypothetical protein HIR57_01035 [Staphylococcus coagulans]|uniref:hypothetical protein n=1 Tax=Staphylococcus coagulans TaxID=74706 RepID=UPI001BE69848|nr:hypothetical protein [Staphylococcus coagulans]MBT2813330.1 hypothetical protein [Staphylococcus coagulans]MBT2815593.1 hypothetical protein [Staphylococcus coagulans]MBT2837018.1 hypothetical protein [Staphylococcus coagulans]MBT2841546.1 hypothetical protein [Staphylococcus coagulans]MBT2849835.1 hypothetical protein [Staphylococcus coagulans]